MKTTKKLDESQPQKLVRWTETLLAMAFGLGVIALGALFIYVLVTQVFISPK